MANRVHPLPQRLLSEFDSLVTQMFESIDDGDSRYSHDERFLGPYLIELTWLPQNHRFGSTLLAEAELKLVSQIAEMKRQHQLRRNLLRPICRIPAAMLTKILSSLSVKDQLSIIRVCQHLREHAIGTPGLWTHVDQIQTPAALSFVLERTGNNPVDVTNLFVEGTNDVRFEAVAAHMHHIRALDLHLIPGAHTFTTSSRAYTAFTATAPVLQSLSFCARRGVGFNGHAWLSSDFSISEHIMPRLSVLQLHEVEMSVPMCRLIQSLCTLSFSFCENSRLGADSLQRSASQHLRSLTTINIELAGWNTSQGYPQLGPSVKQINIRWTKPGLFVPRDTVPNQAAWNSVQAIHVAHMSSSSADQRAVTSSATTIVIPETKARYQTLIFRTSGATDKYVHIRAIDREDRERVFCGLRSATVAGMVARIPRHELSAITLAATAVALRVLSNARCPALSCIRLVLDTDDIAWIDNFARDMPNIKTVERLEFSQEAGPAPPKWTTAMIIRTISSCVATGNELQEVQFLGFSPEAQCMATVGMLSQQVVVDRNWRELKNERTWFTEPPFQWL